MDSQSPGFRQLIAIGCLMLIPLLFSVLVAPPGYARQEESPNGTLESIQGSEDDANAFFENQVKPILESHCLECHGQDPDELGGHLALISRSSILTGGDSGAAIDLQNPDDSLLLDAINYGSYEMPPSGKLSADKIDILTRWVGMGLPWPGSETDTTVEHSHKTKVPEVNETTKAFWSFRQVARPTVPLVQDKVWVTNDIDRFVLAQLEAVGLSPAPPVSKTVLVRRAYYDLIGLPPTPAQVQSFVDDQSDNAFSRLIDELLESPHYGEKWGRHWLDLVRYAESNSFERDGTKPFVWRYRDYVIESFNDDKPYDRFLMEQLAGDEFDEPTAESMIATGYYRLGQWDDEPADPQQALYDDLDDILATTSQAMLGLTINCARCHDHKIDPIPTTDYYRMLAFFRNVRRYGVRDDQSVMDASTRQIERDDTVDLATREKYEQDVARLSTVIADIEQLAIADFEPVERDEFQYDQNRARLLQKRVETGVLSQAQWHQYEQSRAELKNLKDNPPNTFRILCVKELQQEPDQTHVLIRGNPQLAGDPVEPGFVSVLSPPEPEINPASDGHSSGRRTALARWIASAEHPLTARVIVNRIWQHHFGRGIVRSTSDFGFQGERPTHPLLLDYLADEFVNSGWSIKRLHRMIMNSSTYRMSGLFNSAAYELDPTNDLFWRFDMRRLTAEEIRDSILAVSGRLNCDRLYGPSVFASLSQEVLSGQSMPGSGWGTSTDEDARRRSIYVHVKRSLQVPLLASFDAADTETSCPVRFNTTQPTQALGLLNSEFTNHEAAEFAQVVAEQYDDLAEQVREILLRVTQREPSDDEIDHGVRLIGQWRSEDGIDEQQALSFFCLLAMNLNEFIFLE